MRSEAVVEDGASFEGVLAPYWGIQGSSPSLSVLLWAPPVSVPLIASATWVK